MVSYIGIVLLVFIGPFIYYRQSITSRKLWISKQLGVQTFLVYPSPAAHSPVQIIFSYRRQNRHCKPYTRVRGCANQLHIGKLSVLIFLNPENAVSTRSHLRGVITGECLQITVMVPECRHCQMVGVIGMMTSTCPRNWINPIQSG